MDLHDLPFSPKLIAARWQAGKLPSEELPLLAQDALELGYDGRFIRQVAGLIGPTHFDLEPLMPGFLGELGIAQPPDRTHALVMLAQFVCKAIVERRARPYDGAHFIWMEVFVELAPGAGKELTPFVGNASEYVDCEVYSHHPEDTRRDIESAIIEDATRLAASAGNWR